MKLIVTISYILLMFSDSYAQLTTQKKYRTGKDGIYDFRTLDLGNNGILLYSFVGNRIVRLNNNFDTIWVKSFVDFQCSQAIINANNEIILVGQRIYPTPSLNGNHSFDYGIQFLKLNLNGNILISKYFFQGSSNANSGYYRQRPSIIEYRPNKYIVSNLLKFYNWNLLKLDSDFNILSNKFIQFEWNDPIQELAYKNQLIKKNDSEIIITHIQNEDFYYANGLRNRICIIDTNLNNTSLKKINDNNKVINNVFINGQNFIVGGTDFSNRYIRNQFDSLNYYTSTFITKINFNNTSLHKNRTLVYTDGYSPRYNYQSTNFNMIDNQIYSTPLTNYFQNYNSNINDSINNNLRVRIAKIDTSLQIKWNKRLHIFGSNDTLNFNNQYLGDGNVGLISPNNIAIKNNQLLIFNYLNTNIRIGVDSLIPDNSYSLTAIDTSGNNATCNSTDETPIVFYDSLTISDLPVLNFIDTSFNFSNNIQLVVNSPLIGISNVCLSLKPPKSKFFWYPQNSNGFNFIVCKDSKLFIYDRSYNEPKTWKWIFPPQANISEIDSLYLPSVNTISFSQSGVYPVKLVTTNDAGTDTSTQYITVINFIPQPSIGNDTSLCYGDTLIISYKNPPNSLHYFSGPNIYTDSDTLKIFETGEYVLAAYTACGYLYDTIFVNVANKPMANFVTTPITCGQQQVQFIDSSLLNSNPSISYQWGYKAANITGAFTNFSTQQNPLFNFATLDSFRVRLIVSSALACVPSDTIVKTIYLKAKPIAAFTASNICGSLSASFTTNSSVAADTLQSYHWRFGNSQSFTDKNPVFTFATYGTKTVQLTVTSSRGCTSDTVTQSIVIKAKPTIGSGITKDSICANTPFALSASALVDSATISNYQWQLNGVAIGSNSSFLNQNISTPVSNSYTILATSSQGCVSDTAVILIAIVGKPSATFTASNNCGSKIVSFNATASAVNDVINTYWWSFGDGTNSQLQNPTKTYTNFNSGYTVQLVATSSKGCRSDTTTLPIPVKDKPAATLQYNGDACANTNFTVTANATVAAATINSQQWWVNDVAVSNNNAQLVLNKPAGNYRIKYLATSSQGCNSDTIRLPIIVDAIPTAAFSTANSCTVTNIVINNNSAGNISRYKWLWGNGDSSLLQNPVYAYPVAGTFNITLQTITANGCTASSRQPITILTKPVAAFTITESCLGKPLTLVNNSTGNNLTYSWTTSDGRNLIGNTPTIVFNTVGNYGIQLQVSNSLGCSSSSSSQNFTIVKAQITASNDTTIVVNQPLQLNVSGANSYSWLPASVLTNANSPRPIFRVNSPGVFPLLVRGTTSQGCLGTDTVIVTVYRTSIGLLLPNAFSPNGDGRNDVLNLNCAGLQSLTYFSIVNRYGQTIFEQRNCRSLGWDGTFKGTKQNPGTYVYYWEGIDFTSKKVNGKGTIVLVR